MANNMREFGMHKAKVLRVVFSLFTFVTFGLGSLPDAPLEGGLLVIGFSDKKPKEVPIISNHGIVLFTLEF